MLYIHLRLALLMISVCAIVARPALADNKPLLEAGSEISTPGEVRPSAALVRVVLGAIDRNDLRVFNECLAERGFKRADYASLLLAVKVDAGAGRNLWFVRTAHEPYCGALYGMHGFQYFWIEEQLSGARPRYRLRFLGGGDFFTVYPEQSHGLNDIEAAGCIATGCRSARMSFDGQKYQTVRCGRTTFDDGREIKKERPCGSDGWRDDQESGFAPPPDK